MAAIIINTIEEAVLNSMAADTTTMLKDGAKDSLNVPLGVTVVPIDNYNGLIPPGSDQETKTNDGIVVGAIPMYRYVSPISAQLHVDSQTLSISTTPMVLGVFTFGYDFQVPRIAQVSAQFSGSVSAAPTAINYYVSVNGVDGQALQFRSEDINRNILSGSWIINIPTGTVSITLFAKVVGGNNLIIDGNDFVNLTVIG